VDRPDHRAVALADRAERLGAGRRHERRLYLGLLGAQARQGALELVALGLRALQRPPLGAARLRVALAGADELVLDAGDLVAAPLDDPRDLLLAALEPAQARGGRGGVAPAVADVVDDPRVGV